MASAPRTTGLPFKPDATGWHVEAFEDRFLLVAVRWSPWCDRHLEGVSAKLPGREKATGAPPLERWIASLKETIEISSAGWGCCTICHPGAEYDQKRADAMMREVNSR